MKNIKTNRDDLICRKIDFAIKKIQDEESESAIEILQLIRYDAERIEKKLIERKKEIEKLKLNNAKLEVDVLKNNGQKINYIGNSSCIHNFIISDDMWKRCMHCGEIRPIGMSD